MDTHHLHTVTHYISAIHRSISKLVNDPEIIPLVQRATQRGHFTPEEDDQLFAFFGRFLGIRHCLLETINELVDAYPDAQKPITSADWRAFLLAYLTACLLVRLDLFLTERLASHTLCQRKLNEGQELRRIPRKQFTAIKAALADGIAALLLLRAMRLARRRRKQLIDLKKDTIVGDLAKNLATFEAYLDPRKRNFWKRALSYGKHAWKRRGASAKQKTTYTLLSWSGRALSEMRIDGSGKKVTPTIRDQAADLLQTGDVLITRHRYAMTNLFLPGFWPHAALYIGGKRDFDQQTINLSLPEKHHRWLDHHRTLEALKDGVHFRPLEETLAVDGFLILRPKLTQEVITQGIARAIKHEGKPYNFDFDFFRSDALVCTEVIYRAYDGLDGFQLPLSKRAGRLTLSAEDLIALALKNDRFQLIAAYGTPQAPSQVLTGAKAHEAVRNSLGPSA